MVLIFVIVLTKIIYLDGCIWLLIDNASYENVKFYTTLMHFTF